MHCLTPALTALTIAATSLAQDPMADARALAGSLGVFGAELAAELPAIAANDANSCLSPASAAMALLMCLAGAHGETADQLAAALAPADWDAARIHRAAAALHERLQAARDGFTLASAQDVWLQRGRDLLPGFERTLRERYRSAPHVVDFVRAGDRAVEAINTYIAGRTNGRIQHLLQPTDVSPDTRIVLTNALYLKARWLHQFDPADTRDGRFHVTDGDPIQVPFMSNSFTVGTIQRDDHEVVRLPYQDPRFAMDLALPRGGKSAQQALQRLLEADHALREEHITFAMPRFSAGTRFSLQKALSARGIGRAFSTDAQFGNMLAPSGEPPLMISDVIQQTWIEVGEKGTEAAAATAALLVCGAAIDQRPPRHVSLDRPFAFVVRDVTTGLVLFAGCCTDPRQVSAAR